MHYTYILLLADDSKDEKFYVGATSNLRERILRHKNKGVETTKKFDRIALVYYEACRNKTDAFKERKTVKNRIWQGVH